MSDAQVERAQSLVRVAQAARSRAMACEADARRQLQLAQDRSATLASRATASAGVRAPDAVALVGSRTAALALAAALAQREQERSACQEDQVQARAAMLRAHADLKARERLLERRLLEARDRRLRAEQRQVDDIPRPGLGAVASATGHRDKGETGGLR